MSIPAELASAPLDQPVVRLALAGALGLFLGLEREWSEKAAGIRTFSLISLLGAVFVVEGVAVAVFSSLLLVLKRELHSMAGGLSRPELRSATEFAILAFVIYPLLPAGEVDLPLGEATVAVEPRVAWLMVVTVAAVGIVNYAIVSAYGGRGIAVTGFFGGLAASTAVVGTMIDYVRRRPEATSYAVAAVLLAVAAMAARNLGIALAFTVGGGILLDVAFPLGAVVVAAVALAAATADWSEPVDFEIKSPFSLRNVVGFGAVFFVVLVAGSLAELQLGRLGFYAAATATGLVSSGGATTSAVILYRTGTIDGSTATVAILLATGASIVVKALLTAASGQRAFARSVAVRCGVVLAVAVGAAIAVVL